MPSVERIAPSRNSLTTSDPAEIQQLWEHFFQRLVELIRKQSQSVSGSLANETGTLQDLLDSLNRAVECGRFPQLCDRNSLWRFLLIITALNVPDLKAQGKVTLRDAGWPGEESVFAEIVGQEPMPEFAAQLVKQSERLVRRLGNLKLRSIAVWKLQGYTDDQIAAEFGTTSRLVRSRLERIWAIWSEEALGPDYWIGRIVAGDSSALQDLWQCYFRRLVKLARSLRVADAEEVASDAFVGFWQYVIKGQCAQVHSIWALLALFTRH
jgi:DNA-directed RNA polymerase specialized sigma24 family protein